MKRFVSAIVLALAAAGSGAATLLGDGSLYAPNDLTIVRDGSRTYEFLDLTSTYGLPVSTAIANHQAEGFRWANATETAALLSAFDFTYTLVPGDIGPATYTGQALWADTVWGMIQRVGGGYDGSTDGTSNYFAGFIDDMPTPGHSTWLYFNVIGMAQVANDRMSFQASGVGTFLVRDAAPVPEPATVSLWAAAVLLAGMWRVVQRRQAMAARARGLVPPTGIEPVSAA